MKPLIAALPLLFFTACTLDQTPPAPPRIEERVVFLPGVREQTPDCIISTSLNLYLPPDYPPCPKPPTKEVQVLAMRAPEAGQVLLTNFPPADPPTPRELPMAPPRAKAAKASTPQQLIDDAQKAAVIYPTTRSFHGLVSDAHYVWQPEKLFAVYLAPTATTTIFLSPGDKLVGGLALDPERYETGVTRVGSELLPQDVLTLHPLTDTKDTVDVRLLMESGRSYALRLFVGKVAMGGVRFEVAPIIQRLIPEDDDLPLPRPQR